MLIGLIILALCSGAILGAVIACVWTMRFPEEGSTLHTSSCRQEDLAMHEIIAEVYAGRLNARR
jgi:hypothetical protein